MVKALYKNAQGTVAEFIEIKTEDDIIAVNDMLFPGQQEIFTKMIANGRTIIAYENALGYLSYCTASDNYDHPANWVKQ